MILRIAMERLTISPSNYSETAFRHIAKLRVLRRERKKRQNKMIRKFDPYFCCGRDLKSCLTLNIHSTITRKKKAKRLTKLKKAWNKMDAALVQKI